MSRRGVGQERQCNEEEEDGEGKNREADVGTWMERRFRPEGSSRAEAKDERRHVQDAQSYGMYAAQLFVRYSLILVPYSLFIIF